MEYIFNTVMDAFGIFFAAVAFIGLGAGVISAFFWIVQRIDDIKFNRQMAAETIAQNKISTGVGQVKLQEQQANLGLVELDPTRPLLSRVQLESGQYDRAMLMLAAKYLETLQPVENVPNSLTYSPHYGGKSGGDAQQIEAAQMPMLPDSKKDFWSLYQAGLLPDKGFLLGHSLEDGSEVKATWKDLYSALIGGQSGSGKSTLIRCILAQSALQGGRFVVIDKHYGSGEESLAESLEPLRHLMLSAPAYTDQQMIASLKNVADIATRRLEGKDKDRTPLILVVDESTALLQRSDVAEQLKTTLGLISQESRKVAVYALCIGQIFNAEVLPSIVRNCFVSFISCRTRKDNARVMSGSTSFAQVAEQLTIGQCVWMSPSGEVVKIAVPNTTLQHIDLVAQKTRQNGQNESAPICLPTLGRLPSTDADLDDSGRQPEGAGKATGRQMEGAFADPEAQRIINLFTGGMSFAEVAKDVFGVDSNGGRSYIEARDKVQETIRNYMNNLGGK